MPIRTTNSKSSGALAAGVAFGEPVRGLRHINVLNTGASDLYVQIFDSESAPADGSVPLWCGVAFAGLRLTESFSAGSFPLTGCYACLSTTAATKTIATAVGYWTLVCDR